MNKKEILKKRFNKLEKHYIAIKEYKILINDLLKEQNIYEQFTFNTLKPEKRAILDAYLESYYLNSLNFFKKYM